MGISTLFISLRWNSYDLPLIRDEGEYAYAAQLIRQGLAPYQHSFLQKPPMVAYSYAWGQALAPHLVWSARVVCYLCVAGATILLGLAVWLEFGARVSFPAIWLFTPMVLLPGIQQFTANTEMFLLLPLMGLVALGAWRRQRSSSLWIWFFAGTLGSMALLFKYTSAPIIFVVLVDAILGEWRAKGTKVTLTRLLAGCVGVALMAIAALGFFAAKHALPQLWECTIAFNRHYTGSSTFGFDQFVYNIGLIWSDWWFLFLIPWLVLVRPVSRVWYWLLLWLAACVGTGGSVYGHYYILLMPFWAVLTVLGLRQGASFAATKIKWIGAWAMPVSTVAVVVGLCLSHLPWLTRSKAAFAKDRFGGGNLFLESADFSRRIRERSLPSDRVYIAGSEPQLLYHSGRFSPTRFVTAYPMMIPSPAALDYQREAIRDLNQHPPRLIAMVRLDTSWLIQPGTPPDFMEYLGRLIAESYLPIGGYGTENNIIRWEEPLTPSSLENASVILYQHK